jgi:NADH dehydrogenase FAD-containing subunit
VSDQVQSMTATARPRVIIVGGGFGGLSAARLLARAPVGIAPAAKQMGRYAAAVIRARVEGASPPPPFRYRHQGSLATIGRNQAVVDFGWMRLSGRLGVMAEPRPIPRRR